MVTRVFLRNRLALVGGILVGLVVLAALSAPLLARQDPLAMDLGARLRPPSAEHLLGTDQFGRDVFARIMYGARISVKVGLVSVGIALGCGLPLGSISGYVGGALDHLIMRIMDAVLAFPAILLALALVAALGPDITNVMIAIGIRYTPIFGRLARAAVLAEREKEYVAAARALGLSSPWILVRQILPNCLAPLLVQATASLAQAIIVEASLSFIGVGTPPPTPSWGTMLFEARGFIERAPLVAVFPGLAICLAVLGFNLMGDGVRDLLDPRLRVELGPGASGAMVLAPSRASR
ncbi:MAG: ABC transporter permease [Candidatus Rokubacteria bacterium]|nr:ABC transporter permease [Candidatus Rokubacteria bacterium]